MTTIIPEGEKLRRAVRWVSQEIQSNPEASLIKLAGDAALKFDLTPKDSDFLIRLYQKEKGNLDAAG